MCLLFGNGTRIPYTSEDRSVRYVECDRLKLFDTGADNADDGKLHIGSYDDIVIGRVFCP